jgi:hypothetical protein
VKEEKNKKQLVMYTKEQINRAKEVIKLHHSLLDHPSNKTLINALNNGIIIGTRLTEQDVVRSEHVFGRCIHCIAGKTIQEVSE